MPADEKQESRFHVLEKVVLGTPAIVGFVGRQNIDLEWIDIVDIVDVRFAHRRRRAPTEIPERRGEPWFDAHERIERAPRPRRSSGTRLSIAVSIRIGFDVRLPAQ